MATKLNDFLQLVDGNPLLQRALMALLTDLATDTTFLRDRYKSQMHLRAGIGGVIRIKGGSASPLANLTNATSYVCNGLGVVKAANVDLAALSGTVTNAKFNVYCFFIDSAGTLTSAMGTEGAALVNVVFPAIPAGKAMIGYVTVNPTGTGNFVGGTTNLDDGTVVPNAVFTDTPGPQDPKTVLAFTNT